MEPAFRILDAIARGEDVDVSRDEPWIEALQTIRWLTATASGLALTAEGRRAHAELATELQAARPRTELA